MKHRDTLTRQDGDKIIFRVFCYADHVYNQGVVSFVFRQPLDDILALADESDGTARGRLARILERSDGVESLRFHRYSIDVMHAQTYSGFEIRATINAAFVSIGCDLHDCGHQDE